MFQSLTADLLEYSQGREAILLNAAEGVVMLKFKLND